MGNKNKNQWEFSEKKAGKKVQKYNRKKQRKRE